MTLPLDHQHAQANPPLALPIPIRRKNPRAHFSAGRLPTGPPGDRHPSVRRRHGRRAKPPPSGGAALDRSTIPGLGDRYRHHPCRRGCARDPPGHRPDRFPERSDRPSPMPQPVRQMAFHRWKRREMSRQRHAARPHCRADPCRVFHARPWCTGQRWN